MPIDSTDDVEVVETQIVAGSENGDQVDSTIEDGDSNLSPEERDFAKGLIDGDDGEPWDDGDTGGDEGSEGSSFGDALQGGDETTDNGGNPEGNPSDGCPEGGDTSTGGSPEGGDTSGVSNQRERTNEPLSPQKDGEGDSKPSSPELDENTLISKGRKNAEDNGEEQRFDQVTAKHDTIAQAEGALSEPKQIASSKKSINILQQRQHQNEG